MSLSNTVVAENLQFHLGLRLQVEYIEKFSTTVTLKMLDKQVETFLQTLLPPSQHLNHQGSVRNQGALIASYC
jgi:hypothetical protein